MDLFQKDITFLGLVYDQLAHDAGEPGKWITEPLTKTASFKELDQRDRDQHKFHFKIVSFFSKGAAEEEAEKDEEKESVGAFDSDAVYDLTTKFIKKFMVIDPNCTAADKESILTDSGAILEFGLWLVKEKFIPFFLRLRIKPTA